MVAITVVLAFLFFITVDIIVLKVNGKTHPAFEKDVAETGSLIFNLNLEMPKDVLISKGHTMIKKLSQGLLQVGIDYFILRFLKNISLSENIVPGKILKRGDIIFKGSIINKPVKIYSPVDGIIKFVNADQTRNNKSMSGLNLIILPDNPNIHSSFLSGAKAVNWMNEELVKLEDFLTAHSGKPDLAGMTMYDGGKPVENSIELIIENNVEDFENLFLTI